MEETQPKFSEEAIRRFLLGGLSASERASFEQSLVTDDELEERVRLAELELSDDYAADRLSELERNTFEAGFLLTADRHRQLDVSRALRQTLSSPASLPVDESIRGRFINLLGLRRPAWKYAFAALILMVLMGTVLLVTKQRPQIAFAPAIPKPPAPKPKSTQTPQLLNHPSNSAPPSHTEPSPALPLHEGLSPSVVLNSNTPLDAAPVIKTTGDMVTLELRLDQPLADLYEVTVMTTAGESLFIEKAIKRTQTDTLDFDVPASAIESGDFQIALTRVDGESKQSAGIYYFRVR